MVTTFADVRNGPLGLRLALSVPDARWAGGIHLTVGSATVELAHDFGGRRQLGGLTAISIGTGWR
jgi:hypothetical protein